MRLRSTARMFPGLGRLLLAVLPLTVRATEPVRSLDYSVTWVGNSFPGASNRWVQNFLLHTKSSRTAP